MRVSASILDPQTAHMWSEICERSLHQAGQNNSGIPRLKQQITKEIQSYRLKSQVEKKLLLGIQSLDKLKMPQPSTASPAHFSKPADTVNKPESLPLKEDPLITELNINRAESEINMSSNVNSLTTELVFLWRNGILTDLKTPNLALKKNKDLFKEALSILLPVLGKKKKFTRYLKQCNNKNFTPTKRLLTKIVNLLTRRSVVPVVLAAGRPQEAGL